MNQFEEYFSTNKNFVLENGTYCLSEFSGNIFEKEYQGIRTKEGRMYPDEVVRYLPDVSLDHPLSNEWGVRKHSARQLLSYLQLTRCKSIVEIGCGNGWLTAYLQNRLKIPCCGIDIEKVELEQAARISNGNSVFVYGDIFSGAFDGLKADVVLLPSCVQYFPDLKLLIRRVLEIGNTIHIIDSPIYEDGKSVEAKKRSSAYFHSKGSPAMQNFYYHHEMSELDEFDPQFMYNPSDWYLKIWRMFTKVGPFPWIKIDKAI